MEGFPAPHWAEIIIFLDASSPRDVEEKVSKRDDDEDATDGGDDEDDDDVVVEEAHPAKNLDSGRDGFGDSGGNVEKKLCRENKPSTSKHKFDGKVITHHSYLEITIEILILIQR